ncbi:hypothetical protein CD351_11775 [Erythrobacter sp. KY5]|uniref:hypothetical protein n=1 Tax=Erythrobacter sp. KY5 TaxID=2011159 RepID=UPI000DBF0914|nr:hypothetical protein [Erythrobacter sp. KY5]AWW75106.1 hypothetical protein CD351_11775 [Erythrobacter sp. KY5]
MDFALSLSVAGTLASALGFLVTIVQLRRTATATQNAANAIGALKNRMAKHDLLSECLIATKSLQHAARALNNKQWDEAVGTLLDAQTSINRISVSPQAAEQLQEEAAQTSEGLIIAISDIEDCIESETQYEAKELIMRVRKFASKLDAKVSSSNQDILE